MVVLEVLWSPVGTGMLSWFSCEYLMLTCVCVTFPYGILGVVLDYIFAFSLTFYEVKG